MKSTVAILMFAGLALAGSSTDAQLTSSYTNSFDTASSVASWIYLSGLGYFDTPMTWDGSTDAGGNVGSGSATVFLPFGPGFAQVIWFGTFGNTAPFDSSVTANGTLYSNITVDVHVAAGTPLSPSGDFGTLQIGLTDFNLGMFFSGSQRIPANATNGWAHLVQPINHSFNNISNVFAIEFGYSNVSGYPTTPITFWLDNVAVTLGPPPTMATPIKPVNGLNLFSIPAGGLFQRVSAELVNTTGNGWLGVPNPVTYSVMITNYPNPSSTYSNYQTQIFIVTGNPPTSQTAPDYNEANLVFLDIENNRDGTAVAAFRYKINLPNNINVYGPDNGSEGTLATLKAPTIFGTWSMTFNQDTNVTLTGPTGASTNFTISTAAAAQFVDPLNVYVGSQPNTNPDIGQDVVLGGFSITGNATPVSDNFTQDASLDPGTWQPIAPDPTQVQLVPSDSAWWVGWTVPDTGWSLQTTNILPSVATTNWTTLTGPNALVGPFPTRLVGNSRWVLLLWSSLDATDTGFFRLIQDH